MRVQLGRSWPVRRALCVSALLAASLPGAVLAQSIQLGGQAGGKVGTQAGGSGSAASSEGAVASAPEDQASHVVQEGDTLWGVAGRYYEDPYAWPRLWSYNPQVTNPHYIYPGDVLSLGPGGVGPDGQPLLPGVRKGISSRRAISAQPPQSVTLREQAYLDADALAQSGTIMGSNASHMLLSVSDEVYVEFEQEPTAPVGRELTVFRRYTEQENSPRAAYPTTYDPDNPGEMVRVVGTLKVLSYDREKKVARAEVVEALDVIERGFRVANQPNQFVSVSPRTNQRSVESTVVAAIRPVELIGQHQVVFVGAGAEQGVTAGNRFFVFRQGDEWRKNLPRPREDFMGAARPRGELPADDQYPTEVIGELLVLHTRPQSSTAVVTHAVREVVPGDTVRMTDGY